MKKFAFFAFMFFAAKEAFATEAQKYCDLLKPADVQKITGMTVVRQAPVENYCAYYTDFDQMLVSLSPGPNKVAGVEAGKKAHQEQFQKIGMVVKTEDIPGVGDRAVYYGMTRQLVWTRGGKGYSLIFSSGFQQVSDQKVRSSLMDLAEIVNQNAK